jgi:proteic killer suppression protein
MCELNRPRARKRWNLHLEFANEHLRRLAEDVNYRPEWNAELVRAYRKTVQLLGAAKDVQDLRALRSVGLTEGIGSDGAANPSIPLTGPLRLRVKFPVNGDMQFALLLSIEDGDSKGVDDDT